MSINIICLNNNVKSFIKLQWNESDYIFKSKGVEKLREHINKEGEKELL